jgi:hypothetical protein
MPSEIVGSRLRSILDVLNAGHRGGAGMANASIGRERELFINMVLGNIISQPFRIGSGEIVDRNDVLSGQTDIVIEYANTLSFPSIYPHSERLYLAESVCAVVEVKSNISVQWSEVVRKAGAVAGLVRHTGATFHQGSPPPEKIPVFAVGYAGWESAASARDNLNRANAAGHIISGVLQINPTFYVAHRDYPHEFEDHRALFGFLMSIEQITSSMLGSKPPFFRYVR